jgi:phenylalanyl-tRNA synthetase beta chain
MKVPVDWLNDYVELSMPLDELANRLAISSVEVDRIVRRGVHDENGNLGRFLVGRVLEAAKHPNADRLQLCQVDVGEGQPRQIVCGAWNFGAGDTVAVALPGARLPGADTPLAEAKLRGELSRGMILSERELELGTDHSGIIVLAAGGPEPGTPLQDVLPIAEQAVLEVEVTGNRPDLLSIYGLAREVSVLYDLELAPFPGVEPARASDESVDVRVEDPEGCPVYIGRLFRDVQIKPSPVWLRARLVAAGMRPISNVVDATNHVMLALGSPLHAFDYDTLAGPSVVVRRARAGEEIRTLDGVTRKLDPTDLLIADGERPIALAGIMGGEETEVTERTTNVLLEAANFEPIGILQSSERHKLRTEGSNRWEKGVDPHVAEHAARFASELIVDLAGARWAGEADVRAELPSPRVITYRPRRANELIGVETPEREQRRILERLGFDVSEDWRVTVPTWRARDVTREVDVVEEIARFELERVPFTLPRRRAMFGRLTPLQRLRRRVEDALVGAGFSEAYTWSLVPEADALVRLGEPLSAEHAALRRELLPSLLEAVRHNESVGNDEPALFEIARVYLPSKGGLPDEELHVGAVAQGESRESAFLRAKGGLETLLTALKIPVEPLATDSVRVLGDDAAGFELALEELLALMPQTHFYEDVITFPAVKQDLAFVVADDVRAGDLIAAAKEAAGEQLRSIRPFDVYRGAQVGPGQKSIAFAVEFQSPERTLADEDAAALRERIVQALGDRFGAVLRA